MPSKSNAQARLMAACAHGFKPKNTDCPPHKVAKEYSDADSKTGRLARAMAKKR